MLSANVTSAQDDPAAQSDCDHAAFFNVTEADDALFMRGRCALSAPIDAPALVQPFYGGYMIWRGDVGVIYILLNPDTVADDAPTLYTLRELDVRESEAADNPGGVQPQDVFAHVWGYDDALREALRTPSHYMARYTMTIQAFGGNPLATVITWPYSDQPIALYQASWRRVGQLDAPPPGVIVQPEADTDWSLAENGDWVTIEATYQPFEHGLMVWSPRLGVTVFYDDGRWQSVTWQDYAPPMPDLPADADGLQLPLPQHAFGKVWAQHDEIQQALGFATDGEEGFRLQIRYEPNRSPDAAAYYTEWRLFDDTLRRLYTPVGTWDVITGSEATDTAATDATEKGNTP